MKKPKLLILSHILPVPAKTGQQQRLNYSLKSLRCKFDITFATIANNGESGQIKKLLSEFCDRVVCLPSLGNVNLAAKLWHHGIAQAKSVMTGLLPSNYFIGDLEFSPSRIRSLLENEDYDCVLYEYWHASRSVSVFRQKQIPCVLDMHNILWQSRMQRQKTETSSLKSWKNLQLSKYIQAEETAWREFDALVTINAEEYSYVKRRLNGDRKIFYAPMGIDLQQWSYAWMPEKEPLRIAYYGGLGSAHNQASAFECYNSIMPLIWRRFPETQLWLVGSNPPKKISALAEKDGRVKVPGYVENVAGLLRTMSVVVCPWEGLYGFRSRLIEIMALGVPLVTTYDAVYGMEFENNRGILLGKNAKELAQKTLSLLNCIDSAEEQSRVARLEVEKLYSLESTYDRFTNELIAWLENLKQSNKRFY